MFLIFLICFVGVFGFIQQEATKSSMRMSLRRPYESEYEESNSDDFDDLNEILKNIDFSMDGGYLIGCIKLPIRKPNPMRNINKPYGYLHDNYLRHEFAKRRYRF
jgi:hypothetical protein